MNAIRINKPFSKSFQTLLGGEVVSYSPRTKKVAIGKDAYRVASSEMEEIVASCNDYGDRFHLVVKLWNKKREDANE